MRFNVSTTAKGTQLLPRLTCACRGASRLQARDDMAATTDSDGFAAFLNLADQV